MAGHAAQIDRAIQRHLASASMGRPMAYTGHATIHNASARGTAIRHGALCNHYVLDLQGMGDSIMDRDENLVINIYATTHAVAIETDGGAAIAWQPARHAA
ncbi:hypothetical protein H4R19_004850 [Coemansia spiralis]|nr:hypothetical protein H4R19_004850 [Coemansia spiralis]